MAIDPVTLTALLLRLPLQPILGMEHFVLLPVLTLAIAGLLVGTTWQASGTPAPPRRGRHPRRPAVRFRPRPNRIRPAERARH